MSSLSSDIFLMNPKHNMRPLFHIDAVVMLADRVVKVFVCVENVKVNLFYKWTSVLSGFPVLKPDNLEWLKKAICAKVFKRQPEEQIILSFSIL